MIEQARKLCMLLIKSHGEAKLSTVTAHLSDRGFSHLSSVDVQQLLSTLVLEGSVCWNLLCCGSICDSMARQSFASVIPGHIVRE
jgi:hypothetical protein